MLILLSCGEMSGITSRVDWFTESRFGMFVHWGPYSVGGRGEWVMNRERIPQQEYEARFASKWEVENYNPAAWVALAKEVGMGYVVLTARHHDGFALWDTATTGWNSVKIGPRRDLIRPFVEAVRAAGLKVGLYYSGADWTHPDYPGAFFRDWPESADWASEDARLRFVAFYREQLRELMSDYGTIDMLWYDGCIPEPFEGAEVNAMVRGLQPEILINERNGEPFDFRNSEQTVNPKPGPWEACMTLNANWGWHVGDTHWKTAGDVIELLINCASKGGNLLLNVGPLPDGTLPPESVRILLETGGWLARNREFLPRSERHALSWNNTCQITVRGSRVYLHFHQQPGPEFCWAELKNKVVAAWLLNGGHPVDFYQDGARMWLRNLPVPLSDHPVTTIVLEVEGSPEPVTNTTTFWIPN